MGLIQKKERRDAYDDIEVLGRDEGPFDGPESQVELVNGTSAKHFAARTDAHREEADRMDAMVADAADENLMEGIDEDAGYDGADGGTPRRGRTALLVALAVVAVIAAGIGGYFVGRGGPQGMQAGTPAVIAEDQLDDAVATWTYKGATHQVTAREAIESQYGLDAAKNEDGMYAAPSSEVVLGYIRNAIMMSEAKDAGLSVTDEEVKKFAEEQLGTSSYADIAAQYQVSEEQAKNIVAENALMRKLYEQKVPDSAQVTPPKEPSEPKEGMDTEPTEGYAKYIIGLAGEDWDDANDTWASQDSVYAGAVGEFDGKTATFEQASNAYYVAFQEYANEAQSGTAEWSAYANSLYEQASITLHGAFV